LRYDADKLFCSGLSPVSPYYTDPDRTVVNLMPGAVSKIFGGRDNGTKWHPKTREIHNTAEAGPGEN